MLSVLHTSSPGVDICRIVASAVALVYLRDGALNSQLLAIERVRAGHDLVHVISAGKGDKAKPAMRLLASGRILGDVCILQVPIKGQQPHDCVQGGLRVAAWVVLLAVGKRAPGPCQIAQSRHAGGSLSLLVVYGL